MRIWQFTGAVLVALMTVACANLESIHRHDQIPGDSATDRFDVITNDAQQRVVGIKYDGTNKWIMCAEPSPDAIAALNTSSAAGLKSKKVAAEFAAAVATQVAAIGLRTQSITLMRDEAYRLCEGFLNGALDRPSFIQLHTRFQNLMMANLAIEQLTGAIKPTVVVIGGSAGAGGNNQLLDAQSALDQGNTALTTKTAARKKAEEDLAATNASIKQLDADGDGKPDDPAKQSDFDTAKKKASEQEAALTVAKSEETDATTNVATLEANRDAARLPSASASSGAPTIKMPEGQQAAVTTSVSEAVVKIITAELDHDNGFDFCYQYVAEESRHVTNADLFVTCSQKIGAVHNRTYDKAFQAIK